MRCAPVLLAFLLLLLLSLSIRAATFTTNALITEADTSFDGQDIVIDGATLTVDGRHYFNSLLLTNGAVLTHSSCTASETHKLDLVVSNEVVVSTNSRIDTGESRYAPVLVKRTPWAWRGLCPVSRHQMIVTGYCAMAGSWLTTSQFSARAWATMRRSKGSL